MDSSCISVIMRNRGNTECPRAGRPFPGHRYRPHIPHHPLRMLDIREITAASRRIADRIVQTPLVRSPSLSDAAGHEVLLKLECQQTTGSFKLRGATNALRCLTPEQKSRGVVCVSTGNHGRGLAHAARQENVRAVACMTRHVPRNKVDGIAALGADVRLAGENQNEAEAEAERLVREEGMTMVHPFDQLPVIAGQGTLGLEILHGDPGVDTIVMPLSGGGLCAGVALAARSVKPGIRIIGVTMEHGPGMVECLKAGRLVHVDDVPTLADALSGGVGLNNQYTFRLVREQVDSTILVSEREIAEAIRHAYFEEQQVIEGSAAVGIAALLAGKLPADRKTAIIVTGRNIDMAVHHRLVWGNNTGPDP